MGRSAHHITERLCHTLKKSFEVQTFCRLKLKKLTILEGQSSSNNCSLLIQQNQVYAEKSFPRRTTSSSYWAGKKQETPSPPSPAPWDGWRELRNLCYTLPSTVSPRELQPQPSPRAILTLMASKKPVNLHHFPFAPGKS